MEQAETARIWQNPSSYSESPEVSSQDMIRAKAKRERASTQYSKTLNEAREREREKWLHSQQQYWRKSSCSCDGSVDEEKFST